MAYENLRVGNVHGEPSEVVARLVDLRFALETANDPAAVRALVASLPASVSDLAPEVALALAELAESVAADGVVVPVDASRCEPRVALRWARIALASGHAIPADLVPVVTGWSLVDVHAPAALVERMVHAAEPELRRAALEAIEPLVEALAITAAEAAGWLAVLANDPELEVCVLRLCTRPWLGSVDVAARRAGVHGSLRRANAEASIAAIDAAASLDDADALRDLVEDMGAPAGARARALSALGALAEPEDLARALAAVAEDPVLFDTSARTFFAHAHRHGVFVRGPEWEVVLALYDRTPAFTADELVRIAFIVRAELLASLSSLAADDPRWVRRAAVLVRLRGGGAVLSSLLAAVTEPVVAAAVIDAYAASPETPSTDVLVRWLDVLPQHVLPALRVKGDLGAIAPLEAFALDPLAGDMREAALDALWALPAPRDVILANLDGAALLGSRTTARVATNARLLARREDVEPMRVLEVLTRSGDNAVRADVARLFRGVVEDCVARALAGDFTVKRLVLPDLEQKVFRYGRNLLKEGHVVRPWRDDAPETGRDLVLGLVCGWLDEGPGGPVTVALLEMAARHAPSGPYLRTVERFWRAKEEGVKRAALEALLAAGEDARGLELSLGRLATSEDPRIVAHALEIVRVLRARWAEPLVRAALERPEMAVKKEAALALASMGSAASVPAIVSWLARHDNASFRASLEAALDALAGKARVAVLVEAFDRTKELRARGLLAAALAGRIGLAAMMRLARARSELVDRTIDGTITLADAPVHVLVGRLHRAALRPISTLRDPAERLRREGFSVDAATRLACEPHDSKVLAAVRPLLADFVTWLGAIPSPPVDVVALVLAAGERAHVVLAGALLAIAERTPGLDAGVVAGFVERCVVAAPLVARELARLRMRALALLRGMAPTGLDGHRRWRLLGSLGAVRTLQDLACCLDACRSRPDVAREMSALLGDALALPPARADEDAEMRTLREEAAGYYRLARPPATHWLERRVSERPLDVPVPVRVEPAHPTRWAAASGDEIAALVAQLEDLAPDRRAAAAAGLAQHLDMAWQPLMRAWLAGTIDAAPIAALVSRLDSWPVTGNEARLRELASRLDDAQVRRFVPAWLALEPSRTEALLRAASQERWVRLAAQHASLGDLRLVRFVVPSGSAAVRALADRLSTRAPLEARRLRVEAPSERLPTRPADPVTGASPEALVALLDRRDVDLGVAVRAVHALARGGAGVTALHRLALDRRPRVRSAALRALRLVVPSEQSLAVALEALAIETRRDVALSLMKSLGHGRHEPALPALVECLGDRDPHFRRGARAALLAWGRDVVPSLRHFSRRERPDRRPAILALISDLTAASVLG